MHIVKLVMLLTKTLSHTSDDFEVKMKDFFVSVDFSLPSDFTSENVHIILIYCLLQDNLFKMDYPGMLNKFGIYQMSKTLQLHQP